MNQAQTTYDLTRIFHEKFKHPVENFPKMPSLELRKLRMRLILEEAKELATAFGFMDDITQKIWEELEGDLAEYLLDKHCTETNLVEAADALGDLDVVVNGAMLCCGFDGPAIAAEIFRSNMSKLGEDGEPIVREDGKILKGPNYSPPDIEATFTDPEYSPLDTTTGS